MSAHSSRGKAWEEVRKKVLNRAGGRCEVYGCNEQATTVDHITPKVLGGTDEESNLQAMCKPHNSSKQDKVIVRQSWTDPSWMKGWVG